MLLKTGPSDTPRLVGAIESLDPDSSGSDLCPFPFVKLPSTEHFDKLSTGSGQAGQA